MAAEIGHFGKYHNTLCLSPQILPKHCFQFLLGLTMVPRENKNNTYAKFGETNKEYYGIFRTGVKGSRARCSSKGDKFISNGLEIPIKAAGSSIWKLGNLSPFIEAVFHR